MSNQKTSITLFKSQEYKCSYLPHKIAQSIFIEPSGSIDTYQYSQLIQQGFRRSGTHIYRPECPECQQCVSTRIQIQKFLPNRSQKRCLNQWGNLKVELCELIFNQEHYELYQHYQQNRHHDDETAQDSKEQYHQFLLQSQVSSFLATFRDDKGTLLMVSLIDETTDGLSAVYTFYQVSSSHKGLGTYGILWQINLAKHLSLPYLYLGFWIKDSDKMAYKTNFSASQLLHQNTWQQSLT